MPAPKRLLSCLLLLAAGGAAAQSATDIGCAELRAENAALKARVQLLEAALKSPATTEAPAAAVIAPQAPAPAAAAAPATPVMPAAPGLAPKPSVKRVVVEEEPYSRSGCRPNLLTPPPYAIWMDPERWEDLAKGMSQVDVERQLGPEHYDTVGGSREKWEYGKCGQQSRAQLLFDKGRLVEWRAPSQ